MHPRRHTTSLASVLAVPLLLLGPLELVDHSPLRAAEDLRADYTELAGRHAAELERVAAKCDELELAVSKVELMRTINTREKQ